MPAPPEESEPAMVRGMAVMRALSAHLAQRESRPSADGGKSREQIEHPGSDQGHGVGEEQNAGQHEKTAEQLLDGRQMLAETLHGAEERPDGDRRDDEWDAEPQGIDEEQADALAHRVLARGNSEERGKHRPAAGHTAEGKAR